MFNYFKIYLYVKGVRKRQRSAYIRKSAAPFYKSHRQYLRVKNFVSRRRKYVKDNYKVFYKDPIIPMFVLYVFFS